MKSKYKGLITVFAVLLLIFGLIGSFIIASTFGVDVTVSAYSLRTITERNWGKTIAYFLSGAFISVITYVVMMGLSECLEFLENLNAKIDNQIKEMEGVQMNNDLPPL